MTWQKWLLRICSRAQVLSLAISFGLAGYAAHGQTRAIGPGGGGAQTCAAIHPLDADIMLLGQDVGGILKTTDGGVNWRHVNTGLALPKATVESLGVQEIVYWRGNPTVVFASTWGGLFRSSDGAETWTRVLPAGDGVVTVWPVSCVAVDPLGQLVLAGTGDPFEGGPGNGLYRSENGGQSFAQVNGAGIPVDAIYTRFLVDSLSPAAARHFYAATDKGLFRSTDSGLAFSKVSGGFRHDSVRDIALATSATVNRFWLALDTLPGGNGGVYRSSDGLNWTDVTGDLPLVEAGFPQRPYSLVVDPTNPDRAYISLRFDFEVSSVYRTTNGGAHWDQITTPDAVLGWNTWFGFYQYGIAMAPSRPSRLLVCVAAEPILSDDGGDTWRQVGTRNNGDGTWTGTGVEVTYVYDLRESPTQSNRIYAGYEDVGLWRSDDGGSRWRLLFLTVTDGVARVADAGGEIHVNPADGNELYAVATTWSNSLREDSGSWLLYSTDGGTTWQNLTTSFPSALGRGCAAVDFSQPPASRTLLFAQHGGTLRRSTDGGKTWAVSTTGIAAEDRPLLFVMAFDPNTPGRVFAGTHTDFETFTPGGALYRSDDGGQSWQRLSAFPHRDIYAIAFVGSPSRVFVGAGTYNAATGQVEGDLVVSDDGGQSFSSVLAQPFVNSVVAHPSQPRVLFAACGADFLPGRAQNAGVYRSLDNGKTWQRLDLPLSHMGLLALLVPTWDDDHIYIGTRGDGILRLALPLAPTQARSWVGY